MAGRILVVDSVAIERITMKVRLTTACHEVSTAASGAEALRMARLIHPRLVLIGASPGDMTGPALCAALRALPGGEDMAVLVQAQGEGRQQALRAGASGLTEPGMDELTLLARIRGLMRQDDSEAPAVRGLAESAATFLHASRPQAVFVADQPSTALGWRHALQHRVGFDISVSSPERALAAAAGGRAADLYLIAADIDQPGGGLRLLSELRSRPHSREAGFVMALTPERADLAPVALDLGAGDVLPVTLGAPATAGEAALRLDAELARKQVADRRRHEARRNLRWAMTDALTGLYNRRYAMPRLQALAEEARQSQQRLAVIVLDIDRFKQVNDSHGHPAGDAVLGEVAARLASFLPEDALLARIGGEEFLVALPGHGPGLARRVAEELRRAVMQAPVPLPPGSAEPGVTVTISAGLAVGGPEACDQAGLDPQALLALADRALLSAKSSGRNRIVISPQVAAA
ncbi:diguanylate cyclase [Paracoccus sp. (in: a-proteobacteria)]|uniref:diguanylate cyclase domain-containing protein n=1 Tax=Paracoccus sp. TaxID=267 RepID=UPI00321F76A9